MEEDIVGTWFPSGYFGHFRSKTRNDILQDYRHAASPSPPNKFTQRVRLCPDRHTFSKHDNRHSFPTDASYFDTGLGRRKSGRSSTIFKPDFISWIPHAEELKKEGAAVSVYKLDFKHGDSSEAKPQRLSPRVRRRMAHQEETFSRQKWVTDYKMYFQHGQPSSTINTDYNTGRVFEGTGTNQRTHYDMNSTGKLRKVVPHYLAHTESVGRRVKSAPTMRLGVGDCLQWPKKQLNHSIVIPNRFDKRSESYKFRNPFSPKLPRKFKDSKPPTKETLLNPPPYHERQKVYTLRPPSAEKRATSYVRLPSTPTVEVTDTHYDVTPTPTPKEPQTPAPPSTPRDQSSITPRPPVTSYQHDVMSMTPAATAITDFSPMNNSFTPAWVRNGNSVPTVVVN